MSDIKVGVRVPNTDKRLVIADGKGTLAYVDQQGVFHVLVSPTDENARAFINVVEQVIGRRLTGMKAEEVL